ncbi:acyl-CoA thioesterase [Olsenella sp. Marseille-P4559]|jgi:acyl-CoA hydrolase|uniref:acyl-CoA thioesterase n=1 Tax=Olsenella sp. Marseille-P4559 TaxID=2364795 RepID=UPI001031546E|nr:acyl-CoA thioesterase [Olsenella sp. Marseille-P4559]
MDERSFPRGNKSVSDSLAESMRIVRYEDINGNNRLFGGRLMEWIDEAAGVAARKHCGRDITTACVDQLTFKNPVLLNDVVAIVARVTHVGRTSMEVRVDSYVEDVVTGERRLINEAYLTEVCVDSMGNPTPIEYGLAFETDEERRENEDALKRIVNRKTRAAEGF